MKSFNFKSFEIGINKPNEGIQIDKMHEEAKRKISNEEIPMNKFRNLYGEEIIKKDEEYVSQMEKQFTSEKNQYPEKAKADKIATILEGFFCDRVKSSDWLGQNVKIIKTSRYDDIVNGIDVVAEFQEPEKISANYLGLAIDVTISSELCKKFDKIKKGINKGELAKVKYFKSDYSNFRNELSQLPRAIITVHPKTVLDVAELQLKDKEALTTHFIQFQILGEILLQMKTFSKYAEKVGQLKIAETYNQIKSLIEGILKEKTSSFQPHIKRNQMSEQIKCLNKLELNLKKIFELKN